MKKNKAFTLIELLAVIVILAIIALIATPIILGIVEDTKKDAFERSVEFIISSTDLDVMNKLTEKGYEYKVIDGKISDSSEIGYVINKEVCKTVINGIGIPAADTEKICNNEAHELIGGLTLTEMVIQNPTDNDALEFISMGVVEEANNYLDLGIVKNAEELNGTINYNVKGKESYAIYNNKYCVVKK